MVSAVPTPRRVATFSVATLLMAAAPVAFPTSLKVFAQALTAILLLALCVTIATNRQEWLGFVSDVKRRGLLTPFILTIISGLCFVASFAWLCWQPSAPSVSDALAADTPSLKVQFVPEGVSEQNVLFHFSVTNLGPGKVEIHTTRTIVSEIHDLSQKAGLQRIIPQGGVLTLPGSPVNDLLTHRVISLELSYGSPRSPKPQFTSVYRFILRRSAPLTPIDPVEWGEKLGSNLEGKLNPMLAEQFAQPVSTVVFAVSELKDDGSPNIGGFSGSGKSFLFNGKDREALFSVTHGKIVKTATVKLGPTPNNAHVIFLEWDDPNNHFALETDDTPAEVIRSNRAL